MGRKDKFEREELIQALIFVGGKVRNSVSKIKYREYRLAEKPELPCFNTIRKKFGSWNIAKKAAGLNKNNCGSNRFCNDCAEKENCTRNLENCEYYHNADLYFREAKS